MPELPPDAGARPSRRALLAALGAIGGAALAGRWREVLADAASVADAGAPHALSAEEFADLRALCGLIVPADAEPGAIEAGAPEFIDRALAGALAARATEFRAGLEEFRARARAAQPGSGAFAGWPVERQQALLTAVEETPFFTLARDLTVLGLLAMPAYGGNRDGIGWKLIGFADQHVFQPPFGYYDRDYPGFEKKPPDGT